MAIIWKTWELKTADARGVFIPPVAFLLLDMCGAGGAGGSANNATLGAAGGSASPCVCDLPLIVTVGSPIAVRVASPLAVGDTPAINKKQHSMICGPGLLSPFCDVGFFRLFSTGWGLSSGGSGTSSQYPACWQMGNVYTYGIGNGALTAAAWSNSSSITNKNFCRWMGETFMQSDGARTSNSPASYGLAGKRLMLNVGLGLEHNLSGSNSAGGGGGGCPFGDGGEGGDPAGDINGKAGNGNGSGGGGGASNGTTTGGLGAIGAPGLVRFKFPVIV